MFAPFSNEPGHSKIYKMACVPHEDLYQPVFTHSLIRVFSVHINKLWAFATLECTEKSDQVVLIVHVIFVSFVDTVKIFSFSGLLRSTIKNQTVVMELV